MDHGQYTLLHFENNNNDGVEMVHYEDEDLIIEKVGDELLIDMVRSRPYLYNKAVADYKNTKKKENAWQEIAAVLNLSVAECQSRWLRLRQHYSKERQQRELETKSGAGKTTRKKWPLYEALAFLGQHIARRNSFSNVALKASVAAVPQSSPAVENNLPKNSMSTFYESLEGDIDTENQSGKEKENDSVFHENCEEIPMVLPSNIMKRDILVPSKSNIIPTNQFGLPATPASTSSSSTFESELSRQTPTRCYLTDDRKVKRPKVDPVETAFHRMNTTITTMVDKICSQPTKANVDNDNDADVIIGKLVTAELKNTPEPKKGRMKKKFMNILYSLDED